MTKKKKSFVDGMIDIIDFCEEEEELLEAIEKIDCEKAKNIIMSYIENQRREIKRWAGEQKEKKT